MQVCFIRGNTFTKRNETPDKLKTVEQEKEDLLLEHTIQQAKEAEHKVSVAQVETQLRKLQAEYNAVTV